MTFTYKISRRLALSHLGLAAAMSLAACSGGEPTSPTASGSTDLLAAVRIAPKKPTIEINQAIRFFGAGFTAAGDSMAISMEWTATGGSITADGLFSASTTGNFRVIGKGKGHNKSDTSTVVVVPPQPTLTSIAVTPDPASVLEGKTVGFAAIGKLSDGSTAPIGVVWSATGGKIDAGGTYTAGMIPGAYRVVATNTSGTTADTVPVSVAAPQLAQIVLAPATLSLATGATQQFTAYARTSTGDSIATPVSFSATGGTVTSAGLYTAGQTTGAYRVIATSTTQNLADTSVVTIQAPSLAQLFLVPAVVSVATSGTVQFRVYGRTAAGDSVATQATYTGTGGTINSAGLYSAGLVAGTFRVIATEVGGTKADTSTVTVTAAASHAGWYVSPTGSSGSTGSSASPWSLAYALGGAGGRIAAGDTVWLRGGSYNVRAVTATVQGSNGSPVIIRQYPGEKAVVDGTLYIAGADVWYWGFEQKTDYLAQNVTGIDVHAARVKLINLVIHDNSANGIGFWNDAPDGEVVGSILYNNGYWGTGTWPNPDTWGHGMYMQNQAPATKLIRQNILFQTYGYGFHLYTQGSYLDNFTLSGNVDFPNGMGNTMIAHGGISPPKNLLLDGNWFYDPVGGARVRIYGDPGATATITNNFVVGGTCFQFYDDWSSGLTVRGNTSVVTQFAAADRIGGGATGITWGTNTWYGNSSGQEWNWNSTVYTFAQWQSLTGLGSSDNYAGTSPGVARTLVQANPYETGRGHVTIYNPSGAGSVSVNISSIVSVGQPYAIRNVYDLGGSPLVSGTYAGGSVSIPMSPIPPPMPYNGGLGWNGRTPPQALPQFGAFVVTPT